jgi:hypothetical protein
MPYNQSLTTTANTTLHTTHLKPQSSLARSQSQNQGGFSQSDKVDIDKLIDKMPILPRLSIYF